MLCILSGREMEGRRESLPGWYAWTVDLISIYRVQHIEKCWKQVNCLLIRRTVHCLSGFFSRAIVSWGEQAESDADMYSELYLTKIMNMNDEKI